MIVNQSVLLKLRLNLSIRVSVVLKIIENINNNLIFKKRNTFSYIIDEIT